MENRQIHITLPDGSIREYPLGITGLQIAESISKRLANDALALAFNDRIIDLGTPIEQDGNVRIFTWKDPEGKEVYWHSSSHLMAHAIQELHPEAKFGVGPAIEEGFYYDIDIETVLTPEHLGQIEAKMNELTTANTPFVRRNLSKPEAIKFFTEKGDQYKCEIISGLNEHEETISTYTEGSFIDLCRGPHVPATGKIKFFKFAHNFCCCIVTTENIDCIVHISSHIQCSANV